MAAWGVRRKRKKAPPVLAAVRHLLVDDEGMPTTPYGRDIARHALAVVRKAWRRRITKHRLLDDVRVSTRRRYRREVLERIVDDLVGSGRLVEADGFLTAGRTGSFSAALEAGSSVLEAMGLLSAARLVPDGSKEDAADVFVAVRRLHGLHLSGDGSDRRILVPERISVRRGSARTVSVLVLTSEEKGIVVRRAGPDEASVSVAVDGPVVARIDMDAVRRLPRVRADFSKMPVFILGPADGWYEPPRVVSDALRTSVRIDRSEFETALGTPVPDAGWNCFLRAVRRVEEKGKTTVLQRMLSSMLDPEARKAAMRSAGSRIALYEWYLGTGGVTGVWRRQASAAWPILSGIMPELESVVDAGEPLTPALCARFGIGPKRLAELRGQTWQKLSTRTCVDLNAEDRPHLRAGLALLPDHVPLRTVAEGSYPERMADRVGVTQASRRKAPWHVPLEVVGRWADGRLGGVPHPSVSAMMGKDMPRTVAFCMSGEGADALRFTAGHLRAVVGNAVGLDHGPCVGIRVLLSAVLGPAGSFKAWKRFDEGYHRRGRAVSTAWFDVPTPEADVAEAVGWAPGPSEYAHARGWVRWLLRRNQVVAEGETMQHCVGSYWPDVRAGWCCIGAVGGVDGSRATVELGIVPEEDDRRRDGRFVVGQLFGSRNGLPSDDCVAVVDALIADLGAGRIEPDWKALERIRKDNAAKGDDGLDVDGIARTDPAKALDVLRPILPPALAGFSVADLVAAFDEERGAMLRAGAVGLPAEMEPWRAAGAADAAQDWDAHIPFDDGWDGGFLAEPGGPPPWDEAVIPF